jgi:hypothetical protein
VAFFIRKSEFMTKKYIILLFFFFFNNQLFSQNTDSLQTPSFLKGQITATKNGISLIPNFSLNHPAVMFDMVMGKGRLSFDPMIRFGMNGKPWAFVFWWRYKLIQQKKFVMGIGAHPSVVFREITIINNGVSKELMATQRYFAWEVSPTYFISKKINLGLYYLGSKGLTKDIVQNTTFITIKSGINFNLGNKFALGLIPQFYYLKMDTNDGFYTNLTTNLFKNKFPISLNAVVSQAIKTEIAGKDFLWSVGLVYNINNTYLKKK